MHYKGLKSLFLFSFSGADLSALVRETSVAALKEFMSTRHQQQPTPFTPSTSTEQQQGGDGVAPSILHPPKAVCIQLKHVEIAFQKVKPSVSEKVFISSLKAFSFAFGYWLFIINQSNVTFNQ